MPIRVESKPVLEIEHYSRTMNEAFGPHARLSVDEFEYDPKRELRVVIICLVITAFLFLGLACMKAK